MQWLSIYLQDVQPSPPTNPRTFHYPRKTTPILLEVIPIPSSPLPLATTKLFSAEVLSCSFKGKEKEAWIFWWFS